MSETTFVRLTETNEREGETWNWWLQLTGNEEEMGKFAELLRGDASDEPPFELHLEDVETESVVDKLVQYAGEGYYAAHNKVRGEFACPWTLGEDMERLYKGGIKGFFLANSDVA